MYMDYKQISSLLFSKITAKSIIIIFGFFINYCYYYGNNANNAEIIIFYKI